MLITIAKHKRLTEEALDTEICRNKALTKANNENNERLSLFIEGQRREIDDLRDRLAKSVTRNSNKASEITDLQYAVELMKPMYELGLKRRANMDADNARRRAARVAK